MPLAVVYKYVVLPFTVLFISSHPSLEFSIWPTDYIAGCLPISLSLSEVVIEIISHLIKPPPIYPSVMSTHISE
jgi:hypothetical protein